eukprot:CAMPEP_0197298926 /NCGR_PEP_ID=MMETSP0890-20130614/44794_1 /TAXON_ID=44058 ORGANISM="Aureoumbra lagunensis, Strain CCMP1510" /NCGR_SAMPLE_ID=MMETSP0890 /ASSEMBLY_ACC=CAM_ASM_000533 /LENGTH=34 /DNA_ID= /DNA_START= /DNA_END= /DNA_ORIENTATION=
MTIFNERFKSRTNVSRYGKKNNRNEKSRNITILR